MKKTLSILSILLTVQLACNAQQLSFGAKAGVSMTTMNAKGEETKNGFHGGVFGELRIANFAIQPELLYSMQGAGYDYETLWDDIRHQYAGKVRTTYLSVPVMLKYYVVGGLGVEVGPQFGFLLSAINEPDNWESKKIKEIMKKTDVAANFGISYKLPIVPVGFYARYSLGLTDIFEKGQTEVFDKETGKNQMVQLGMFVQF